MERQGAATQADKKISHIITSLQITAIKPLIQQWFPPDLVRGEPLIKIPALGSESESR